jgi:glycerol-3-phosphate dehydrogenase (NAD(P)+)
VDNAVAEEAQRILTTPNFHIFISNDVTGVELGGALKNIIALGAGMADGLELGDNAKAAFVTLGWGELTTLGVALGANPLTFSGLAGLGDLITTCASPLSRNHYLGREVAKGRSLAEITASIPHVAEGVSTIVAARDLAQKLKVEIPITELIYRVLFESFDPRQAMTRLMLPHAIKDFVGGPRVP